MKLTQNLAEPTPSSQPKFHIAVPLRSGVIRRLVAKNDRFRQNDDIYQGFISQPRRHPPAEWDETYTESSRTGPQRAAEISYS